MEQREIISLCRNLLFAYSKGLLGQTRMPEDSNPGFTKDQQELRLVYFTLPMSLNYQRDSYKLWEAALNTYNDKETRIVFDLLKVTQLSDQILQSYLLCYKLALQPNKHIQTWKKLSHTIHQHWGSITQMLQEHNSDFLLLQKTIQQTHKKEFPYLSGPKIFHYWCFILQEYGKIKLKNAEFIEIAPDTHITQCSVRLGVITQADSITLTKDQISQRWRKVLQGSGITPIQMHPPLWFWSRNRFVYELEEKIKVKMITVL